MKKALIVFLVLILLFSIWFFWKGGHHAIALAGIMTDWLSAGQADQTMSITLSQQHELSLSADTFWTQYTDKTIFGISAQGMTAYTDGEDLYMDTGRAYALPELTDLREAARRLTLGMVLYGRITKTGDTYHIAMKSNGLELAADLTADSALRSAAITAVFPDETTVSLSMTTVPTRPHPIPQTVADAMVQARMEPPLSLTEPLEVLLPALEALLPLEGDLTLGVECGILELKETVRFRMDRETAEVERKGVLLCVELPGELTGADPALLGLLLLRNGSFVQEEGVTQFEVLLTPEITTALLESLVPQAAGLDITMDSSTLCVQIRAGRLSNAIISAEGSIPFLITTIPVTFTAELSTA